LPRKHADSFSKENLSVFIHQNYSHAESVACFINHCVSPIIEPIKHYNNKHNHRMAPPRPWIFFIIILIITLFCLFFSIAKGSTSTSLYQLFFHEKQELYGIILQLRLKRTLAAFICGGALALAGLLMQLLLQNPLADPYVLGISGGAAFGTLLLMLLGVSTDWLLPGAWLGSLGATVLIMLLAKKHAWQAHSLLLAGIALACGFSAANSFILVLSPANNLHSMLFWLSGDLNDSVFPWYGIFILALGFAICMLLAPGLDLLTRGEQGASALGLSTRRHKIALYVLSSLLTATAVTIAGCVGFIGLIIPHITRRLVGINHHYSIPASILLGGSLLMASDTFARSLFAPAQIPVGILVAMVGVPLFIGLLQR
jgi:iron complex transport system permease protein